MSSSEPTKPDTASKEVVGEAETAPNESPQAKEPSQATAEQTSSEEPPKETTSEVVAEASAEADPTEAAPEAVPAGTTPAETASPGAAKETTKETTAAQDAPPKQANTDEVSTPAAKSSAPASESSRASPIAQLWELAKSNGHPEIWGVNLADPESHVPSQIVFQKYLNANDGDLAKAKDQLSKTLEWRAKTKPLELVKKAYNQAKFGGLGYVTNYVIDDAKPTDPEGHEVFTWNIYGGVKSIDETFGNLNEFIEWRVALMELALAELSLPTATKPITATEDPYKIFQVHDYKSISFFRQSPLVKSASSETIKVFAQNYPELLKEKFFVNVPAIMGFVYAFMKLLVAPKTIKKFHPMSNGANLAGEFPDGRIKGLAAKLPTEYGGKGGDLKAQGKATALE